MYFIKVEKNTYQFTITYIKKFTIYGGVEMDIIEYVSLKVK